MDKLKNLKIIYDYLKSNNEVYLMVKEWLSDNKNEQLLYKFLKDNKKIIVDILSGKTLK